MKKIMLGCVLGIILAVVPLGYVIHWKNVLIEDKEASDILFFKMLAKEHEAREELKDMQEERQLLFDLADTLILKNEKLERQLRRQEAPDNPNLF